MSRINTVSILLAATLCLTGQSSSTTAHAQTRFELSAPNLNRTSQATLTEQELRVVDQQGRATLYARYPALDTADGRFSAYRSSSDQVIRWPTANRGAMQLGTNVGGRYEFRTSQMQIVAQAAPATTSTAPQPLTLPARPVPGNSTDLVLPPGSGGAGGDDGLLAPLEVDRFFGQVLQHQRPEPQVMRLTIRDDRGRDWFLGNAGDRLAMQAAASPSVANWHVVPAGRGLVRVTQPAGRGWSALAVENRSLNFVPLGQQANQLWRVMQLGVGSGYWLESAVLPGYALTGTLSGAVTLLPVSGGFGQVWLPQPIVITAGFEPMWRTLSQEVRANPPLPPAQIDLVNSHSDALIILIADNRSQAIQQLRIEPNQKRTVPFERDAGATIVETYELRTAGGLWDRQQFVTQIPPVSIYDLSVYEVFLQSIAIDRTGTSPNPIEDVNYQPRSLGWLPLPPGNALPDRGMIDAYQDAKAAGNPGAVRRFQPKSLEKASPGPDPLKSILNEVAPRARKDF